MIETQEGNFCTVDQIHAQNPPLMAMDGNPHELYDHTDANGFNRLMVAAQNGDTAKVQRLLALGFDPNSSNGCESAISLAYNNNHFDAVLVLLESNAKFPDNFDAARVAGHEGVTSFAQMSENFLENAKSELDKVKRAYPKVKHFYSLDADFFNKSAAFVAFQCDDHSLYRHLVENGVSFAPEEFRYFAKARNDERKSPRPVHALMSKSFATPLFDPCSAFYSNCYIGEAIDEDEAAVRRRELQAAFEFLNAIDEFKPILEYVTHFGSFRFVFDFKREHLESIELPQKGASKARSKHIYVGVKGLLSETEERKRAAYGAIIKEIKAYAIELHFDNKGLPYRRDDKAAREDYQRVVEVCRANRLDDRHINEAFNSSHLEPRADLITRPVQMTVVSIGNPDELLEQRIKFEPLQVYDRKVVDDMARTTKQAKYALSRDFSNVAGLVGARSERVAKLPKNLRGFVVKGVAAALAVVVLCSLIFWLWPRPPDIIFEDQACGSEKVAHPGGLISTPGAINSYAGEWPWLATIFYRNPLFSPPKTQYICGATLLTNWHLLTAAHCVAHTDESKQDLFVLLGRFNISDDSEENSRQVNVSRIFVHSYYSANNSVQRSHYDIAVLRLAEKVAFTSFIQPACFPAADTATIGVEGIVAGYGQTSAKSRASTVPKHTKLRTISDADCKKVSAKYELVVSEKSFCGGNGTGVPCRGDSGSGFVVVDKMVNRFFVTGVVSQAINTEACNNEHYVTFANVLQYRQWVIDQISRTDKNEEYVSPCVLNPCGRNAKCTDNDDNGRYECKCPAGFEKLGDPAEKCVQRLSD